MANDNQGPGISSPASSPPLCLPPGTLLHQAYRIGAVLGQGGFGITYRAFDERLGLPVAVKEFFLSGSGRVGLAVQPPSSLAPGMYQHTLQRFLDEAQSLARFDHPGIVRVLTSFEENGTGYIVMEFLQGETLEVWLGRVGRLSETQVARIAHSVGEALSEVHRAGLLHQDVKPANIMSLPNGRLVLVDFGAARQHATTRAYTVLLTPGYAPPEQYSATGQRGPYSDVYSLGATLYQLLTGAKPPTPPDRAIGQAELVPARQYHPQVSQEMSDAISWALTMDKKARPQTVEEFLRYIAPPAAGEGADARPGPGAAAAQAASWPPAGPGSGPWAAPGGAPPASLPTVGPGGGSWPASGGMAPGSAQAPPPPSWHPSGGAPPLPAQAPPPSSWHPSGGVPPGPVQAPPPPSWHPSGGAPPPPAQAPPPPSWHPSGGVPPVPAQAPPPQSWQPSGGVPPVPAQAPQSWQPSGGSSPVPAQAPLSQSWQPAGGAAVAPGWSTPSPPPLAPTMLFQPPAGSDVPAWGSVAPAGSTTRSPSRVALVVAACLGILLVAVGIWHGVGRRPGSTPSGSVSSPAPASPPPLAQGVSPAPSVVASGSPLGQVTQPPPATPEVPVAVAVKGASPSPVPSASAQLVREFRCQGEVNSVDWTPPPNELVVAASDDRTVRLWNVTTGIESLKLRGPRAQCRSVAVSPDGKIVATVVSDGRLFFFNRWENRQTLSVPGMNSHATDVLAFSRSGLLLGTLTRWRTLAVVSVRNRRLLRSLRGPADLTSFAFSPDGSKVALSGKPPVVVIFDTLSGQVLKRLSGHRDVVQALDFSPNGRFLASVAEDGTVRLWDVRTGVSSTLVLGQKGFTLRFSPDGRLLAAGCTDGVVRVFRIEGSAGSLALELKGGGLAKSVSFRRGNSSWLAAGFSDGRLRVWRLSGLR